MKPFLPLCALMIALALVGCGSKDSPSGGTQGQGQPSPTAPAAPTGLNATPGDSQVTLTWTASTGATSYHVKRASTSGGAYTQVSAPTGTTYTDMGRTNGTTYYYVVSALNAAGEGANSSEVSAIPAATATIPAAPTNLAAISGNGQVVLTWTASVGATSYHVKRASKSGGAYTQVSAPTGATYTDTGLTNGTTYYYVVSAQNAAGEGANSSEASATPAASVDLGQGLTSHGTSLMPYTAMAKPAVGQRVADPDFGTTIVRITDIANGPSNGNNHANVAMPAYPSAQAWNSDETRLILYVTTSPYESGNTQGWAMFDGKSYQFIKFLDINPSDIEQFWWSRNDPKLLYYISNYSSGMTNHAELTSIDVESGTKSVVHDFMPDLVRLGWPTTGPVRAGYPFANGGGNNQIWGLGAGGIANINGYLAVNCFGFNMSSGTITQYSGIPLAEPRTMVPAPRLSGKGWFWNDTNFPSAADYQTWVLDSSGAVVRKLNYSSNEHIDTALNAAGQDLVVGVQFDTPLVGNIVVANLETGEISTLVGESNGYGYTRGESFISATAYLNSSWVAGAAVGAPYGTNNSGPVANPTTLLDQEVFIANIDTGAVFRVAHHRSTSAWSNAPVSNYFAQPNVTISPTGTRLLVQSDWGCANPAQPVINPNATVDTYVIELPSYAH